MNILTGVATPQTGRKDNKMMLFLKKVRNSVVSLFQPEEVEVTFKVEGKRMKYTYTKVQDKQVA